MSRIDSDCVCSDVDDSKNNANVHIVMDLCAHACMYRGSDI